MWAKLINNVLDFLLFIVPALDLLILPVLTSTEAASLIPPQYMGYYMLGTVVLRRLARYIEDVLKKRNDNANGTG